MATPTQKPLSTGARTGFGAYGGEAGAQPGIGLALDPPPASKVNGSLDFAESDKRWLKDLGITTTNPLDFDKAWAPENVRNRPHRWGETYGGRLAIRSVSRGIVGAAFFAAAQMYASNTMKGYVYTPGGKNPLPADVWKKPLQFITWCIDKTVGRSIFNLVKLVKPQNEALAKRWVTFRDTRNFGYGGGDKVVLGRSVGHEAVAITFDFACMSFGDYMTRYVLGFFDPNAKIKWMKDGKINMPAALKDVLKNIWTGISYAAGEDMAVAIPYIYGMRLQRNIINKFSPGFKIDSDAGANGGSFKVKVFDELGKDGKNHKKTRVVGDYQLEGMLDLSGRFSWYNVGTKMFRDTYSHAANALDHWWHGDRRIGLSSINPAAFTPSKLVHTARDFVRYVARTIIKVMMYMLPATFFFYITRTPQSKFRGLAINPDAEKGQGLLGRNVPKGGSQGYLDEALESRSNRQNIEASARNKQSKKEYQFKPLKPGSSGNDTKHPYFRDDIDPRKKIKVDNNPFSGNNADAFTDTYYQNGVKAPWYNKITNPIGKFCYNAGSTVNVVLQHLGAKIGKNPEDIEEFSRIYANASIAYTPYFMAKTDLGSTMWDTKRTDLGIDRMLGGAAHLKWSEFSGGFSEVYRSMLGQPFADPAREQLAKEAMKRDEEKSSNEGFQLLRGRGGDNTNGNGDEASQKIFATEDKKANRSTLTTLRQPVAPKPREASWTEAMNKSEAESRNQTIH